MRSRKLLLAAAAAVAVVACQSGATPSKSPTPRPMAEGEIVGGPAMSSTSAVRSLLSLSCVNGQLILKTNLEGIVATMDCATEPLQAVLDRFLGQPVTIAYTAGKLHIANPNGGALDIAAAGATIRETDATP